MKKFLLASAMVLGGFAMYAQDVEDKAPFEGESSNEISALRLATDLVKYGNAQRSALPLIDALQIIIENPASPSENVKDGEVAELETSKGPSVTLDTKEIINAAKKYADGDANLLAILSQLEKDAAAPSRGAVNGSKYNIDVVRAGATDTYNIRFVGGRTAEVAVSGDGDTDLDLYVYDANGNLIGKDISYSDDCYVSWVPRWTGNFKIKVVNRGRIANRYVLLTN